MSDDTLIVLFGGQPAGVITRSQRNRLRLRYESAWRDTPGAYPLSISMPLAQAEHGHDVVDAFLWGLLPDNEVVIERWARQFQVSARSCFDLLGFVGEDCAGAVQLVRPERVKAAQAVGGFEWLDDHEIATRLRTLRENHAAGRAAGDSTQFSLAGAQPKTAFACRDGRFGIPKGRNPTTHIFKPPATGFDGHTENEHLCLALAHALGLASARSEVRHFEDEIAIVVERFDRVAQGRSMVRVHQEDMCQALGIPPARKYQNDRGPSPENILELIRNHSSAREADVASFVDALGFNWIIGGSDAHAKNYALLHGAGGRVRLAPLYDLASALPYFHPKKIKLAMKIGGTYRLHDIGARHWQKLAVATRLDPDQTIGRLAALAERIPDAVTTLRTQATQAGLTHPTVAKLLSSITTRARSCAHALRKER